MGKTGRINKKYSPEFKLSVILDMLNNHLGYGETVRKYWNVETTTETDRHRSQLRLWERIYLEEGAEGFMIERRGRKSTDRPRMKPISTEVENDLISENQRLKERLEYLEMENEYLKKLNALSQRKRKTMAKSQSDLRIKAEVSSAQIA